MKTFFARIKDFVDETPWPVRCFCYIFGYTLSLCIFSCIALPYLLYYPFEYIFFKNESVAYAFKRNKKMGRVLVVIRVCFVLLFWIIALWAVYSTILYDALSYKESTFSPEVNVETVYISDVSADDSQHKESNDVYDDLLTLGHIDSHMEDIDDSTAISGLGYCDDNDAMFVEFKSNGYVYAYWDVPRSVYDGIWEADSKGGYFHEYIRGVYEYTRFK